MSREERQEAMKKFAKDSNDRFLAVLTDDQKKQFDGMKGEIIEIDSSQFRNRRRGQGRRRDRPALNSDQETKSD